MGALVGTVVVDVAERTLGEYVAEAQKRVAEGVSLPAGMSLQWTGQFEDAQRSSSGLWLSHSLRWR